MRRKKIVLISCVSKKLAHKAKAAELYTSSLFRGNLRFAQNMQADAIFILSAKYGLLELHEEIEPYDITLNTMPSDEIKEWAAKVCKQLEQKTDLGTDQFVFLAGAKYRKYLLPHLKHYEIPLEGLTIGKQLQALHQQR